MKRDTEPELTVLENGEKVLTSLEDLNGIPKEQRDNIIDSLNSIPCTSFDFMEKLKKLSKSVGTAAIGEDSDQICREVRGKE